MLKRIPPILSPDLLKIMMEMGHGDELVLADGNYPVKAHPPLVTRLDGVGIPELLDAMLDFFPLDRHVETPVAFMDMVPGEGVEIPIWDAYRNVITDHGEALEIIELVEREAFYRRTKDSYALVVTGEKALFANIILKKGVVVDP